LASPAGAVTTPGNVADSWLAVEDDQSLDRVEAEQFANLTLKDMRAHAGRKLSLGEKAAFVYAKRQVKRQLRKNQAADSFAAPGNNEGFGIGLLLGFLLGLLGVLIVYLAIKDKKPGAVKGAWIGFGIILGLVIVLNVVAAGGN